MKALDLLRLMDCDPSLAEHGMIVDLSADNYIYSWFGEDAKLEKGSILIEDFKQPFFVIWDSVDTTAGFPEKHEPDAVVRTDEDKIYLWRIEG